MQFGKPKTPPQFEEWLQRFRICCGFWSSNLCQALIHSGRIAVQRTKQNALAVVPARDTERRRHAETKACGPVREAARSAGLKAVRCRCIGAYPNAVSR